MKDTLMMTVFVKLLYMYFVFVVPSPSGKLNYIYNITIKRQRCPNVVYRQIKVDAQLPPTLGYELCSLLKNLL